MARSNSLFAWRAAYNTQIAEIDRQHRELGSLLNHLHRALLERAGRSVVRPMVGQLIDAVAAHFADEERLMRETSYPKASHHRLEHALLRTRALNFQRAYETERTPDPMHTLLFLKDWLHRHLQGADKLLAEHLQAQGLH